MLLINTSKEEIDSIDSTVYYNKNSKDYFNTTVKHDISELYDLFTSYLPKEASILDAGCGSGRDTKYFQDLGYKITAFDGALELVKLASNFTDLPIAHKNFSEINYREEFDGIWTSASLLHVYKDELLDILYKFKEALKLNGIWYMSFRYGNGEKNEGDRYFYDQTEDSLKKILMQLGDIEILNMYIPENTKSRRGYKFIVCVVRKISELST